MPSWGIFNSDEVKFKFIRSEYNNIEVMRLLDNIQWDKRTIAALNKTEPGKLKNYE